MVRKPRRSKARSAWIATLRVGDWVEVWDALTGAHASQLYEMNGVLTVDTHKIDCNGIIDRNRWISPVSPEDESRLRLNQRKMWVHCKATTILRGRSFYSLTDEDCKDLTRFIDRHSNPKNPRL